jgi:hypothetical protein
MSPYVANSVELALVVLYQPHCEYVCMYVCMCMVQVG